MKTVRADATAQAVGVRSGPTSRPGVTDARALSAQRRQFDEVLAKRRGINVPSDRSEPGGGFRCARLMEVPVSIDEWRTSEPGLTARIATIPNEQDFGIERPLHDGGSPERSKESMDPHWDSTSRTFADGPMAPCFNGGGGTDRDDARDRSRRIWLDEIMGALESRGLLRCELRDARWSIDLRLPIGTGSHDTTMRPASESGLRLSREGEVLRIQASITGSPRSDMDLRGRLDELARELRVRAPGSVVRIDLEFEVSLAGSAPAALRG